MLNNLKDLLKYKISEVKNGQRFFIGEEEYIRLEPVVEKGTYDALCKTTGVPSFGLEKRVYVRLSTGSLCVINQDTEVTGDFGVPLKDLKIGDYFIDSDGVLWHIHGKSDSACYVEFLGGEDTIYTLAQLVKPVKVTVEDGTIKITVE